MKVSAFTFIKNGEILGYPFIESIKSVLPIVDEFVINVGKSEDNTLEIIKSLKSRRLELLNHTGVIAWLTKVLFMVSKK